MGIYPDKFEAWCLVIPEGVTEDHIKEIIAPEERTFN